jgi:hypothetical protein
LFTLFLTWVYDGNVQKAEDYFLVWDTDIEARKQSSINRHAQLIDRYILRQKLLGFDFKNAVMDLITKSFEFQSREFKITAGGSCFGICRAYANTTLNSPPRRSLADSVFARYGPDLHCPRLSEGEQASKYYEEYLVEILKLDILWYGGFQVLRPLEPVMNATLGKPSNKGLWPPLEDSGGAIDAG